MDKLNQTMQNVDIIRQCLTDYKKYGDNCTIETTTVPFTEIGKIGIYNVNVRFSKLFNQEPSWTYSLQSGGGMTTKNGFESLQEAIDACVIVAEEKEKEFNEKHGDAIKDAKKNFGSTLDKLED